MKIIWHIKQVLKKIIFSNRFKSTHPLKIPKGYTEKELFDYVASIRVEDAPEIEMINYATHDFKRFMYTLGLTSDLKGECLELGSNPYFTTMLLEKFSNLNIQKANYFGNEHSKEEQTQKVFFKNIENDEINSIIIKFKHFNVEVEQFPYKDNCFDVVIFAEIIEHLLNDPCRVLREINRILKDGGILVLTTPNVARLENIAKLIAGDNIYDPYSGYGAYGRHNREYNRHELCILLEHEGFNVSECFTSDVHVNNSNIYFDTNKLYGDLKFRENDLGQYIFIKAKKINNTNNQARPKWLYRSYPDGSLD
jgi:SAM-dependent methyltransferase